MIRGLRVRLGRLRGWTALCLVVLALGGWAAPASGGGVGTDGCNPSTIAATVRDFLTAYRSGSVDVDALFAELPVFRWYSVGRSPRVAYANVAREDLAEYFAERHDIRERFILKRIDVGTITELYGNFGMRLARRARALQGAERWTGKGAVSCTDGRIAVWSVGISQGANRIRGATP